MGYDRPEISLVITDDAAIHALNRTWRGQDKATDVLSFSQMEGQDVPGEQSLGDIVISMETAARQAGSLGHDLVVEMACLLVHGVLHLLGHDHVHGGHQARRMRQEEARVMRVLMREMDFGKVRGMLSRR